MFSPDLPLAKSLLFSPVFSEMCANRRGVMRRERTLNIIWINRDERGQPKYNVAFADYKLPPVMKSKEIVGEDALRNYLITKAKVHLIAVNSAMHGLEAERSASIFHTILLDEQFTSMGLE